MSIGIIELNDAALRASRLEADAGEYDTSPGIAVVNRKQLLLGDAALQQARLRPMETNTLFWHRLSAEPLPLHNPRYRHHADLAYSHLLKVHESIADCDQIIFALPGSFTRQQMSLLLGIVGQCSFTAVGLVDSAVAAASDTAEGEDLLHVDLQLHQCIFTRLHRDDGQLYRQAVDVLPGGGLLKLRDQLAKAIADHFIDQSRFDPLHSAGTEQSLYDHLPGWIEQFRRESELFLEVADRHIKVQRRQLAAAVENIFREMVAKAEQLSPTGSQILLGDRLAALPGLEQFFSHHLPERTITALGPEALSAGIRNNLDIIRKPSDQLTFVQSLPSAAPASGSPRAPAEAARQPAKSARAASHVLLGDRAFPVSAQGLSLDLRRGEANPDAEGDCRLHREGEHILLTPLAAVQLLIRRGDAQPEPISDNLVLYCGDRVHMSGGAMELRAIEVVPGDGP